jgi:aldehyde:ferredoxin oxidoreductase
MKKFGYAGNILKVDLSNNTITKLPSEDYTVRFLGGRGVAAKLFWDMVPPWVKAFDPENCLICVNGLTAGFNGLAGNRWQVCAQSPLGEPQAFSYSNFGGRWGTILKYAGYDGLVVQGKANWPVYILITNERVEIRDASQLWGKSTFEVCALLKAELGEKISILTIGQAAENRVSFATLLTDDGASGSGGLGGVMGSKLLKAIVVNGNNRPEAAYTEELRNLTVRIKQMRERTYAVATPWAVPDVTRPHICYGCGLGCARQTYIFKGKRYKSFCQAAGVYVQPEENKPPGENQRLATRLCDAYGLDTAVMMGMVQWLKACYQEGLLDEKESGLPLSRIGGAEFIETLTRKIAYREGFGDILARGTIEAAESIGEKAKALLSRYVATKGSETKDYDPRLIPISVLLYATEPRRPIQQLHEPSILLMMWLKWKRGDEDGFFTSSDFYKAAELFWGDPIAADFTTYEGKPLAAKMIQDRTYAKESMILCDFKWPMTWAFYPGGHVGDPTLESRIFSAITGNEIDEAGLNRLGERILNLQRAIMLRQGWRGRQDDRVLDYYYQEPLNENDVYFTPECEVMGPNGKAVSRLGATLKETEVEKMKTEYYALRGWDTASGFLTKNGLVSLGLSDIASDLAGRGLLKLVQAF